MWEDGLGAREASGLATEGSASERHGPHGADVDLLVAVGTNLSVFPIANVVPIAVRAGAPVVIVNGATTDMDELATVVVRGSISDVLPRVVD